MLGASQPSASIPGRSSNRTRWLPLLGIALLAAGCSRSATPTTPAPKDSATTQGQTAGPVEHRIDGQPVSAILRLAQGTVSPGDHVELAIELQIAPTWEIHTLDATPSSTATQLELSLPDGIVASGDWQAPDAQSSAAPPGAPVYLTRVTFTRTLVVDAQLRPGICEITCEVGFQACTGRQCLQPNRIRLQVPLELKSL